MAIKNIVFDVGNVLVKWEPLSIISNFFQDAEEFDVLVKKIFKSEVWIDLNLGKISEAEAVSQYVAVLGIPQNKLTALMLAVKESLLPIPGSIQLVKKLYNAGFPLYVITDNTKEIMVHLKRRYDFWPMFQGIVVSADIGHLKPSPVIYHHLLETYQLKPEETLFFDDIEKNVTGARAVNMLAMQFFTPEQCVEDLKHFEVIF
jgi:putative hydrolase of the HAD superfamily